MAPAQIQRTRDCGFTFLAARGLLIGLMAKRNSRDMGLRGGRAGKGDADRSPGWRNNYNDIDWPSGGREPKNFKKVYGVKAPKKQSS